MAIYGHILWKLQICRGFAGSPSHCDASLVPEGESQVEWFEGSFQDYEKDKMRRLGQDSIIPHRMKYKKLTR
jgi:hypothetical protein